jgi:urease accessory protein
MRMVLDEMQQAGGSGGDLPASVRVDARLRLAVETVSGRLRLAERHESGALRFRMPRRDRDAIEAMLVNVAGGLAGGDRIHLDAEARDGARLLLSSAAGERIYRSGGDVTRLAIRLAAASSATLVWLPMETVLHEGARLDRQVEMNIAPDGRMLFGEIMQLGRVASGERFSTGSLRDAWKVRIGDRLVFAEATRLEGEMLAASARPGALAGARFIASLLMVAPDAGERLDAIRASWRGEEAVMAAATAHSGLVFARLLSQDDVALRRAFLSALGAGTTGQWPLPRLLMLG